MTDSVTKLIARSKSAIILSFFGAAWMVAGLLQSRHASPAAISVVCFISLLIAVLARVQLRRRPPGANTSPLNVRAYIVINIVQWVLIFAAALVLPSVGHPEWVMPVSITIVGLHFLPLADMFNDKLYYATGSSMILLAAIYPFASESGAVSSAGLFGAGFILWATAAVALAANNSYKRNFSWTSQSMP